MAYIGFNPSQQAVTSFSTKNFTGDGTTTTFTLDQAVPGANEANVDVYVENVHQNPIDAYTIGGVLNNQLIFSEAPVAGAYIYVIHKGEATYNLQPATGSVTAATLDPVLRNFTVDKFTGNGSTKTFTLSDTPYSPNSILVMVDGIVQTSGTNYTVSGNTLTFDVAPTEAPDNSSNITVVHLGFSSGNKAVMDASITPVKLSPGGPSWTTDYKVVLGNNAGTPIYDSVVTVARGSSETYSSTTATPWPYTLGASPNLTIYNSTIGDGTAAYLTFRTGNNNGSANIGFIGTSSVTGSVSPTIFIGQRTSAGYVERLRINNDGFVAIGTTEANPISGNVNAKNLTVSGDGTIASADGRLVLVNPRPYANITVGSTTAGRVFFGFPYTSTGTTGNFASIDSLAAGSGGSNGYGITLRIKPKSDNGADITAAQFLPSGVVDLPYGQIKFPAAQNASSDPNTLDDYEEGTWTPGINLLGTVTLTQTTPAVYTKIGNRVTVSFGFYVSSTDTTQDTTGVYITGLPFTSASSSGGTYANGATALMTERATGYYVSTAPHQWYIGVISGGTQLSVFEQNYNGSFTNQTYFTSAFRKIYSAGNLYMIGQISYQAA